MSRKDYELIAQAVSQGRYSTTSKEAQKAIDLVVVYLSNALSAQNERFDLIKFLSACEYGKLPRESEVA